MTQFRVPEPSEAAVKRAMREYSLDYSSATDGERGNWRNNLRAAYAIDLPALCRAEVALFAEWFMSPSTFTGDMAHVTGPEALSRYLALRYGFPEAAPTPPGIAELSKPPFTPPALGGTPTHL